MLNSKKIIMKAGKNLKINNVDYKVLISSKDLKKKIEKIASKIVIDYLNSEPPVLLFVANGGLYFGVFLSMALSKIGFVHSIDTVRLKRYSGDGQTEKIVMVNEPTIDLSSKDVIVVEDVVDDGITLQYLNKYLVDKKTKSIKYSVLIEKIGHIPLDFELDYTLLRNIEKSKWLVGFGMDTNQELRGLDFIGYKIQ